MKNVILVSIATLLFCCFSLVALAETTYVHTDLLGSVVSESDERGRLIKRYHYKPYGEALEKPESNEPGYTGHVFDDDLDLNYMQARYYDPAIGRFYSNDPVGVLGHAQRGNIIHGFNRYAYANNNPYKYTDPDGKAAGLIVKFIKAVAKGSKGNKGGDKAGGSSKGDSGSKSNNQNSNTQQKNKSEQPENLNLEEGAGQSLDPNKLSTTRQHIDKQRLQSQKKLDGKVRMKEVTVNKGGQLINGNHRTKFRSQFPGEKVPANVIDDGVGNLPGPTLVKDLPVQ